MPTFAIWGTLDKKGGDIANVGKWPSLATRLDGLPPPVPVALRGKPLALYADLYTGELNWVVLTGAPFTPPAPTDPTPSPYGPGTYSTTYRTTY